MAIHVYKEYLEYLNNLKQGNFWVKKSIYALSTLAFIGATLIISSTYYINTKIVPKKQARIYLETVKHSVVQAAKSLNDVTIIYKVAGAKTQIIAAQNESTPSAIGFNTTIGDIQKSIEGLEAAKKNIEIQKNNISSIKSPEEFIEITNQANRFMIASGLVLSELKSRLVFFKQIQLQVGPSLYLPKLETDSVWGKLTKAGIKDYYQNTSDSAMSAIEKIAKITPPEEFKTYYVAQGKYLDLVRDVSENIVKLLSIEDQQDSSAPSQTEKAYHLFQSASVESSNLKILIDEEKLILQSAAETSNSLAEVRIMQQALEIKLNEYAQSSYYIDENSDNIIHNLLSNFSK